MRHHDNVTAIILAGGLGKRLNRQDKGLIALNNKTLLAHVIERLKPQTSRILISANQNLASYQTSGYPVISDRFENHQGPLAGILSCRAHIKTSHVLTLPCDAPLLPRNLLSTLFLAYEKNSSPSLCVAHDGHRQQNLFMLFPVEQLSHLSDFFAQNKRKVSEWIQSQPHTPVDFSSQSEQFININTENTLLKLKQMYKAYEQT